MKTILIIDDDPVITDVAAGALQAAGWKVDSASHAVAGLAMSGKGKHDAILLDIDMPEIDGTSLLLLMREQEKTKEIPVVLFTANTKVALLYSEQAAGIITKPFVAEGLAEQLCNILGWRD